MNQNSAGIKVSIFFCRQLDENQDVNRRVLEKEYGSRIRFFPLPCSGRIEPLHLLKALETGADVVYLVTCPEGACRHREGNLRAKRRIAYARGLIGEIGLKPERLELVTMDHEGHVTIDRLARSLMIREDTVGPSPVVNVKKRKTIRE